MPLGVFTKSTVRGGVGFGKSLLPLASGPSIVCIGGLSKPIRSAADPRDYRQIRQYADEFRRRRTVYR
jgi:hypothetical protein